MSARKVVHVPIHCTDAVIEKIEAVHDRITQRAYEKWLNRRASGEPIIDFWAAAERELLFRPETSVREWGYGVSLQINCPLVDPKTIRLFMSPTEFLALAPLNEPGLERWLFQYLRLPKPIDHTDASAEYDQGAICVAATVVNAPDERKVHFHVA